MGNALQWFRWRQHGFARVLLAAFGAAWLQFAVLPCTAAHATAPVGGHDHAQDHAAAQGSDEPAPPCHGMVDDDDNDCVYCLGDDAAGGCDYPHEARADLREVGTSFPPMALVSFTVVVPERLPGGSADPDRRHARGPADTSSSLQTLYCRRLR